MTSTKMDEFSTLLPTQDIKKKLSVGGEILSYLFNTENNIECSDIGFFIDGLVPWVQSSNNKVAQNGLEILLNLVERLGSDFRPYVQTVISSVIDRLGDSKELVRERAKMVLLAMTEKDALLPNTLLEKLLPCFSHKNSNVREETLNVLVSLLDIHGPIAVSPLSRVVPHLVRLMSDPNSEVREAATNTIVEVYVHTGDRLKIDLQKHHKVPSNKWPTLLAKFDALNAEGKVTAKPCIYDEDQTDKMVPKKPKATPVEKRVFASTLSASKIPSTPVAVSNIPPPKVARPLASVRKTSSKAPPAGAVDEDDFLCAFDDVPPMPLVSHKELDGVVKKIREQISASGENWEKRVDAMKKLRSLLLNGGLQYDDIVVHIRSLDICLESSLKDLRSQVVRETCITVAFLSQQLQQKFDHSAEFLLHALIPLIPNSAKIISSASVVALRFLFTHTHSQRFIPIISNNMTSKSREIRRAMCEFLALIMHIWNTHSLERHIANLQEAVKKGLNDADVEARTHSRKAFWGFQKHFPEQAEALISKMDARLKQKLYEDAPGSASDPGSTNTINQSGLNTGSRLVKIDSPRRTPVPNVRSNSAIDLQAAQRAKARAQYAALARQKVGASGSLPRSKKLPDGASSTLQHLPHGTTGTTERTGRPRSRVNTGVSQSQPSSRSGSPSSRLNYATYIGPEFNMPPPRSSRPQYKSFCRSTGTSRETSPNRFPATQGFGLKLNRMRPSIFDRPPIHSTRPVIAQKILQQSREAESALADALSCDPVEGLDSPHRVSPKKTGYKSFEEQSDDSETSSVCSERSDSFRRPSDSFSWSGSQQRLYRDLWEPTTKTVSEIIANCESTHWNDRKEGLVGLQLYFQSGNVLSASELKRVTDNFTKMFMDSHTKVFSLFLDTLNELIMTHHSDLNSWLYVLLTRLLNKLGADLLGSIQTKIYKSLDVVRDSFPCELQMLSVLRFLVDATQTPNTRVKTAALNYVTKLSAMTDPHLAFPPPSPGQTKDIATAAISKMIGWTMGDSIKQGAELRRAAQEAILALFNLNTPQVTMRFSQLPKEYQEAAATLIHGRVRRSSNGSGIGIHSSSLSPPMSPTVYTSAPNRQRALSHSTGDSESLNPEEVYRSLRKTTAEIQNYSYEAGRGKLTEHATVSHDSGISQMAVLSPVDRLEVQLEQLSLKSNSVNQTNAQSVSSPGNESEANGFSPPRGCNGEGVDTVDVSNHAKEPLATENLQDSSDAMRKVIDSLKISTESENMTEHRSNQSDEDVKKALTELLRLTQICSSEVILEHFKQVLRILLGFMNTNNGTIKCLVLGVLTEMLKKRALNENFNNYVELLILKVLNVYKDHSKDVIRASEVCMNALATAMAPDMIIRVLIPLIATEDFPLNLASIKMLTRVIENKGADAVKEYLPDVMPSLIKAYDNEDSSVRKSAVFCMVALHLAVGEEPLKPYLSALAGTKLKLLNLYVRRAQQGSTPVSPKNQSPSGSSS